MQAGGDIPNCDQVGNLPHKAERTDSEVKGELLYLLSYNF